MIQPVTLTELAARLLLVIEGLRHAVGGYPYKGPAAFDLVVRVRAELRRRFERFERVLARFRAGALPAPRPAPDASARDCDAPSRAAGPVRDRSRAAPRLPRGKAWLVRMMPYVVALYAIRLRMYADDPETAAFLRACPEARRILRPIWWMVSADPLPDALREPEPGGAPVATPEDAMAGVTRDDAREPVPQASGMAAVVAAAAALALTGNATPVPAPVGAPVLYQFWEPRPPVSPADEGADSASRPRRCGG